MTKVYLTSAQFDIARESIERMRKGGEGFALPVVRGSVGAHMLELPDDRRSVNAFAALLGTLPEQYAADGSLGERKRWGKVHACQNLSERVREWLALSGDGTPIAAGAVPVRVANLLAKIGVKTVEALATWSETELRQATRGFGEQRIADVNRLLARHGKSLRPDPEAAARIRR